MNKTIIGYTCACPCACPCACSCTCTPGTTTCNVCTCDVTNDSNWGEKSAANILALMDSVNLNGVITASKFASLLKNLNIAGKHRQTYDPTTVLNQAAVRTGPYNSTPSETDLDNTSAISADLIPVMTSNNTPKGEVSASSFIADHEPWKAFNDNDGEFWSSNRFVDLPHTLTYDFQRRVLVQSYSVQVRTDLFGEHPKTWTLEASVTGEFSGEQVTLHTATDIAFTKGEIKYFQFVNTVFYRFYRLVFTAAWNNSNSTISLVNIQLSRYLIETRPIKGQPVRGAVVNAEKSTLFGRLWYFVKQFRDKKRYTNTNIGLTITEYTKGKLIDNADFELLNAAIHEIRVYSDYQDGTTCSACGTTVPICNSCTCGCICICTSGNPALWQQDVHTNACVPT